MTFGWIISLPDGTRLAKCSGPVYGPYGTSFRAEGYGFLSVTRFLFRLSEFCGIKPEWRVKLMTDNLGLITRLEKSLPFSDPFPNLTLQPDWDVTNEIIKTIQSIQIDPILEHVKGHQDDHTLYEDLALEAQLNVDADEEAGNYQTMYPAQRPIIPRLPHNRVQLHLSGKVISSKLKRSIREAFTVRPYKDYLQKRYKWDTNCIETIDWKSYTQAISRFHSRRIQITKLCNDLLPTARWANRYDSLTTEHCLQCGELEDRDHIICCRHISRTKWRATLLTTLRQVHDSPENNPYLLDILIDGLHSWMTSIPFLSSRYPRRYQKLIQEQQSIGWRHIFNGHLSCQWRILQDSYIRQRKIRTRTQTGANWSLRTQTTIWTAFFSLWTTRNETIHGHDLKTQNQSRHRRLRAEMELLHTKRDSVLAVDSDAFIGDTPEALETFLTVSTATHIQNWMNTWRPLILSSVKSATDLSIRGVRTLSTYFIPDPTPNRAPRHPNSRAHRTTRPRHRRQQQALPQQPFPTRSLRSFFGINPPTTS
jgi:hypothetical protein